MATKTLTITEDAYERLKAQKNEGESFSDVIKRIVAKRSLMELAGILSDEEADEMRKQVGDVRKRMRAGMDRTSERLG